MFGVSEGHVYVGLWDTFQVSSWKAIQKLLPDGYHCPADPHSSYGQQICLGGLGGEGPLLHTHFLSQRVPIPSHPIPSHPIQSPCPLMRPPLFLHHSALQKQSVGL